MHAYVYRKTKYNPADVWDIEHITNTQKMTASWPMYTTVMAIREMQSKVEIWNQFKNYVGKFSKICD